MGWYGPTRADMGWWWTAEQLRELTVAVFLSVDFIDGSTSTFDEILVRASCCCLEVACTRSRP